jgi:hypothetical protein
VHKEREAALWGPYGFPIPRHCSFIDTRIGCKSQWEVVYKWHTTCDTLREGVKAYRDEQKDVCTKKEDKAKCSVISEIIFLLPEDGSTASLRNIVYSSISKVDNDLKSYPINVLVFHNCFLVSGYFLQLRG